MANYQLKPLSQTLASKAVWIGPRIVPIWYEAASLIKVRLTGDEVWSAKASKPMLRSAAPLSCLDIHQPCSATSFTAVAVTSITDQRNHIQQWHYPPDGVYLLHCLNRTPQL